MPAMCGSATLAMLVSSTSMKVAIVTTSAMIHGLCFGVHAATGTAGDSMMVELELIVLLMRERLRSWPSRIIFLQ